ncbi:MAG: ISNCY family transposase, partial [Polaromonas sp.]
MACHAISELSAPMTVKVLIEQVRSTFEQLPDTRKGGPNQRYVLQDAALSAFAVFFTQSPSFLDYQVRMQKDKGRNNASTLFGVHQIPSDPQIRNLLEPVGPEHLAPLFIDTVELMHRQGQLQTHRALGGLLIALDGTQYFSSTAISCPNCSSRALRNGRTEHL